MKTIVEYLINNHIKHNTFIEVAKDDLDYLEGEGFAIIVKYSEIENKQQYVYIIDIGDEYIGEPFGQAEYDYNTFVQPLNGTRGGTLSKNVLKYFGELVNKSIDELGDYYVSFNLAPVTLNMINSENVKHVYVLDKK